mgnify:CR=1 FL=1
MVVAVLVPFSVDVDPQLYAVAVHAVGLAAVLAIVAASDLSFYYPCDGWWDCIVKSTIL